MNNNNNVNVDSFAYGWIKGKNICHKDIKLWLDYDDNNMNYVQIRNVRMPCKN